MAASAMQRDDDVVLLRPQTAIELPVHQTPAACAGAAASYVLRRIAYRAGAYAPGIQDAIFDELHAPHHGASLGNVERWFAQRMPTLHALGYRVEHDRSASRMRELVAWIRGRPRLPGRGPGDQLRAASPRGRGRGPILHAAGFAVEGCEAGGDGELVAIDPWSRVVRTRGEPPPGLELAHHACACAALAISWTGWR